MRRKYLFLSIICLGMAVLGGCSGQSEETKESKTDWVFKAVKDYNKQDIRQVEQDTLEKTQNGDVKGKETAISNRKEKLGVFKRAADMNGSGDEYINYYAIKDSEAYSIYKYTGLEGNDGSFYRAPDCTEEFVEQFLNSYQITLSKKAKAEILGEEELDADGTKTVKVKVTDSGFERVQDIEEYKEMFKDAKENKKIKKQFDEAYKKYMDMDSKEWTMWFEKDTHKLLKVEYDDAAEQAFVLCMVQAQVPSGEFQEGFPEKRTVTWTIKTGDECDTVNLPEKYKEQE